MKPVKKLLYYSRINSQDPVNKGAVQKCKALMKGFQRLGWQADMVWLHGDGILFYDEILFPFKFADNAESWKNILFNHLLFDWIIAKKIDFTQYQLFFVRYPLSHPGFLWLLKKAKKANPQLKILLEVPTYPYNLEHQSFPRKMQQWLDRLLLPFLNRYVDLTLHYGEFSSLFGIPSFGLRNGVDVTSIKLSDASPQPGKVRLLAVGNWNFWHGLDRLILGLATFYKSGRTSLKVELTIVGGGRELSSYQALVTKYGLNKWVRFVPPTEGKELDAIFDQADLGVGCLGIHRKNVLLDSSLKHRQYCAKGLPFVLSTTDPDFPDTLNWVHYEKTDDSPISIERLVHFNKTCQTLPWLRADIRKYAVDHLDWCIKLGSIPFLSGVD